MPFFAPLAAAVALAAAPPTYVFKTIDFNQSTNTIIHAINNAGLMVADYTDASNLDHCFTVQGATKTPLNDAKGSSTSCSNLNTAGAIVGYYVSGTTDVGFLYTGGTFTDVPGPKGATFSQAYGISDKGNIIGAYIDSAGAEHGFLLKAGKYTKIDAPNSVATIGIDINMNGAYTLQGFDSNNAPHSYLVAGKTTTELKFPGATVTRVHTINNKGLVALAFVDSSGNRHGAVYNSKTKTYTQIDVPGAIVTATFGINDTQGLVGYFVSPTGFFQEGYKATGHIP